MMLNELVQLYVNIDITFTNKPQKTIDNITDDGVQRYAMKLLSYGLLYFEFSDGIRETDGLRILRCWRYLLFFYRVSKI